MGGVLRARLLNRSVPLKAVHRLTVNGHDFKRITFAGTGQAESAERHLRRVRGLGIFPQVVNRSDNELLLEFVPGRSLETIELDRVEQFAHFFSVLHGVETRSLELEATGFHEDAQRDIAFLEQVGVIDTLVRHDVSGVLEKVAPSHAWCSYDYIDSLPKNFVLTPDTRLVGIDVEALVPDALTGTGVAKLLARSDDAFRERFLAELALRPGPDIAPSLQFVEIAFLAGWLKRLFLKGRQRLLEPERLAPHREVRGRA